MSSAVDFTRNKKAIGLFSGGADSTLAIELMQRQGIEVIPLNIKNPFSSEREDDCAGLPEGMITSGGLAVRTYLVGDEYIRMIADPEHGYGSAMNPCQDCKIMYIQKAREVMISEGASFVFTGEVIGQRPNSQKLKQMRNVEAKCGLAGRLLRPLCARLLPPTIPELAGVVDRSKLLDFSGRSRSRQKELAKEYGVKIPGSGGGCKICEDRFAERLKDLYQHAKPGFPSIDDIQRLKVGRHFRFSPEYKIIVGKDEGQNQKIEKLYQPGDILIIPPEHIAGPATLCVGKVPESDLPKIAALIMRYCKVLEEKPVYLKMTSDYLPVETLTAEPMKAEEVEEYLL